MVGMATLTMVASSKIMNAAARTTASTSQRRRPASGVAGARPPVVAGAGVLMG